MIIIDIFLKLYVIMMSKIIKFQLKGIKMIRLKGLNKILRIGLLAGALLGIATPYGETFIHRY
ncbi:hypothetical protein Taitung243_14190 [Helicobacter pylori]